MTNRLQNLEATNVLLVASALAQKNIRGINEYGSLEKEIIHTKVLNDLEIRVLEFIQKVSDWCPEDEITMDEGVDLYLECKSYPEMDNYSQELEKFVQAVICAGRNQIPYIDKGICGTVGKTTDADRFMEDYIAGKVAWN